MSEDQLRADMTEEERRAEDYRRAELRRLEDIRVARRNERQANRMARRINRTARRTRESTHYYRNLELLNGYHPTQVLNNLYWDRTHGGEYGPIDVDDALTCPLDVGDFVYVPSHGEWEGLVCRIIRVTNGWYSLRWVGCGFPEEEMLPIYRGPYRRYQRQHLWYVFPDACYRGSVNVVAQLHLQINAGGRWRMNGVHSYLPRDPIPPAPVRHTIYMTRHETRDREVMRRMVCPRGPPLACAPWPDESTLSRV